MDFGFLLQLLANGIVIGLIYGLVASGLTLQFGILHIVNFAHGELLMLAMYGVVVLLPLFGGHFFVAMICLLILTVVLSFVVSPVFVNALERGGGNVGVFERSLILTLGLSIVLLNGVQYVFTATPRMITTSFAYGGTDIGPVRVTHAHAIAGAVALLTIFLLFLFLTRTNAGRALRAVAQNRSAALMVGLDPRKVSIQAIQMSIVLTAIAGAVLAPIVVFQPSFGQLLLFKAFVVVIIGGMGNISGAVVVAIGLGIVESFVGGFSNLVLQNAVAFVAMIGVLVVRPNGVFSTTIRRG